MTGHEYNPKNKPSFRQNQLCYKPLRSAGHFQVSHINRHRLSGLYELFNCINNFFTFLTTRICRFKDGYACVLHFLLNNIMTILLFYFLELNVTNCDSKCNSVILYEKKLHIKSVSEVAFIANDQIEFEWLHAQPSQQLSNIQYATADR